MSVAGVTIINNGGDFRDFRNKDASFKYQGILTSLCRIYRYQRCQKNQDNQVLLYSYTALISHQSQVF